MSTTPQATPDQNELLTASAPVADKRRAATGVIPKRMQSWIFLTIVFVAAVGLWFSSGSTKAGKPNHGASSATEPIKPVVGGLSPEEVQTRLKESETSSRSAALNTHVNPAATTDAQFKAAFGDIAKASDKAKDEDKNPSGSLRDAIAEEERKREYAGRFASNIALSYRSDPRTGVPNAQSAVSAVPLTNSPGEPFGVATSTAGLPADFEKQLSLLQVQQEKLLAQEQQQLAKLAGTPGGAESQPKPQAAPASVHRNADLNLAAGKNHVIFEGTVLESVLVNRLNGDFAGPVICQISTDVYSRDHNELLIPAGIHRLN